ncbi:LOW QUALITY PROTEIN: hypothetical protein ACHAXR_005284 [Thalassiosira sp. AJA248-18]
MYEEHAPAKLKDDQIAQTITVPPNELAALLNNNNNKFHYYWTSPVATAAPALVHEFQWIKQLHNTDEHPLLDPRGPSLWMGTSGSGTQCHYDVANNIIVQLYGTKRIRIFPPSVGVYNLHVFPDAHPRARKSQVVDFERCCNDDENNNDGDMSQQRRFPHFANLPHPALDVILRPGDALEIPAFWFHHVENGRIPNNNSNKRNQEGEVDDDDDGDDVPSVSLNSFALSKPMMIEPLGHHATVDVELVPAALKALGTALIRGMNVVDDGEEEDFIRRYLLNARYEPLLGDIERGDPARDNNNRHTQKSLTTEQLEAVNSCIERILPDFKNLLKENNDGIALLVGLHLLELWAVEFVGAPSVAKAWDEALS